MCTQVGPRWAQVCPNLVQVGLNSAQVGLKLFQVGFNLAQGGPKSAQSRPKVGQRCPKFAESYPQIGFKLGLIWPKSSLMHIFQNYTKTNGNIDFLMFSVRQFGTKMVQASIKLAEVGQS